MVWAHQVVVKQDAPIPYMSSCMSTTATGKDRSSEVAIFGRLLSNHKGKMSPALARYVLTLGFDSKDQERICDLVDRNQRGNLSNDERDELMNFVKAGHLLALLHSKARQALKKRKVS